MDDLISRQAAIDAIDKYSVWVTYTQGDSQKDEAEFVENIIKQTKKAIQSMLIEDLPSAQPDRSLWFRIGEICVDESKGFISSGRAVEKIRELLREAERSEE